MPAKLDLLSSKVLDQCCDSCFVCARALVELIKVERKCTSFVLTDAPSPEWAAEDAIPSLRQYEDSVTAALSLSQLSTTCGKSSEEVREAVRVHDTHVVAPVALPRCTHELLAVLPACVGHNLACEITMNHNSDLA